MKIGELATITHIPVETIRYYEKAGLMPKPSRTTNNYRTYNQDHIDRLRFIRNCRSLDLSHDEIRALLDLSEQQIDNCEEATQVLAEHIKHVQDRIQELRHLEKKLLSLNVQCQGVAKDESCGILQTLTTQEINDDDPAAIPHTHGKHDFSHR